MLAVGKPSSRPRWSPVTIVPSTMNGAPEAVPRALHVAGRDQGPDPGRGDGLAVDLDQRHDPGLELRVGGQHLRVAFGLGAEAEVLADRDLLGRRACSTRTSLDEAPRR